MYPRVDASDDEIEREGGREGETAREVGRQLDRPIDVLYLSSTGASDDSHTGNMVGGTKVTPMQLVSQSFIVHILYASIHIITLTHTHVKSKANSHALC